MEEYLKEYPPVLSVSQVAEILAVTSQTVRKLIKQNLLVGIRVGNRIRIPKDRLLDYLSRSA